MLKLNGPKMDFILKMFAKDHPDEFKLIDPKAAAKKDVANILTNWSNVFHGKTLNEYARMPVAFLRKYYGIKEVK